MILRRTTVTVDTDGREYKLAGTQQFDLTANNTDIHNFISGCIAPHWHDELEIFVLESGRVAVGTGDTTHIVNAGEGCFINADVLHTFNAIVPDECIFRSFVFDSAIVSGAPGSIFDTRYVKPLIEKGAPYIHITTDEENRDFFDTFDECFDACSSDLPGYEFKVRDCLSKMLLLISHQIDNIEGSNIPRTAEMRMKTMMEWIDQNISGNITVADIAGSVNICTRECQRIFRNYLHYRPIEYVQRRRIMKAADMLKTTNRNVTDIALECGFSSVSYFTKQFRLVVGVTPNHYRKGIADIQ